MTTAGDGGSCDDGGVAADPPPRAPTPLASHINVGDKAAATEELFCRSDESEPTVLPLVGVDCSCCCCLATVTKAHTRTYQRMAAASVTRRASDASVPNAVSVSRVPARGGGGGINSRVVVKGLPLAGNAEGLALYGGLYVVRGRAQFGSAGGIGPAGASMHGDIGGKGNGV